MLKYAKSPALWLAIGLVLGSGALSFAATGNGHGQGPKPKATPTVSPNAEPSESESADDQGDNSSQDSNRKQNHGFFVSQAAHCEDVNDTTNNITFTAPDDCSTNGKSHGGYVSSVAKSDAGKGAHGHGGGS